MLEVHRGFSLATLVLASASVCLLTAGCAAATPPPLESATRVSESPAPVILHGKAIELHLARPRSRGAAFAILAGSEPGLAARVRGVIAFGLANGENLLVDDDNDDDDGAAAPGSQSLPFQTYGALAQLPVRCAVIQSTYDNYLPAADARRLFGADSSTRRFYAVEAKNHRFSGGKTGFAEALRDALGWTSDGDAQ